MFQKTHQHGTIICWRSKKIGRVVWEKNLRAKNRGDASLLQSQEKNGKWHSKPLKVLRRNEGLVSAQYWKARL